MGRQRLRSRGAASTQWLLWLVLLLLGAAATASAVRVARHFRGARADLGKFKVTELDASTKARLGSLKDKVFLTYFASSRDQMPSHFRDLERQVTSLLESMQAEGGDRFGFQVVDPDSDPDLQRYASNKKIAPIRERTVSRDGYSEQVVWSGIVIQYGAYKPAIIPKIGPEHVPLLQSLLMAHLDQMERPRKPVIGLAAPRKQQYGYAELKGALAERGQVVEIDLHSSGPVKPLSEDLDLLLWMEPGKVDAAHVRELNTFLDRGRSAVVAASELWGEVLQGGKFAVRRTEYDAEALLSDFGLHPVRGLALDGFCAEMQIEGTKLAIPPLLSCIGYNQNWLTMRGQPNGNLLFNTPTPFSLDGERLSERGWKAELLCTTSDKTGMIDVPNQPIELQGLSWEKGDPVPKLPIFVGLRHNDPWKGQLLVSSSESPFVDGFHKREGTAHWRLLKVILDTLVADERLVQNRATVARVTPIPEMDASGRLLWRLLCLGAMPFALLLFALSRGILRAVAVGDGAPMSQRWGGAVAFRWIVAATALAAAVAGLRWLGWRVDLTADQINVLSPQTREIAAHASVPTRADLFFSGKDRLPPNLRPLVSRLRDSLRELKRAGAALDLRAEDPDDLDKGAREALAASGIKAFKVTTRDESVTTVRSIYASLRLQRGDRTEVLAFAEPASFENLEFRLAFALWRLETGKKPHIAFASDAPRLSSAEAYDMSQAGLAAPVGTDVYALARDVVRNHDYRVTHVNPRQPKIPDDIDMLVWLQPRRDVCDMMEKMIQYLHRGGRVMLAAQHFNMQSRQYRGTAFKFVYWPQPQSPDVEELYFPDIGIKMVREVLMDELRTKVAMESQVNRSAIREYKPMDAALPFFVRASASNYAKDTLLTKNLGDQALLNSAFFKVDEKRLAELGLRARPVITTSARAWSYFWEGGWVPEEYLGDRPASEKTKKVQRPTNDWKDGVPVMREEEVKELNLLERAPMALLVEGTFPLNPEKLTILPPQPLTGPDGQPMKGPDGKPVMPEKKRAAHDPTNPAKDGKLFFLACSEAFKSYRLLEPEFRADQLLLNAVANFALDEKLAAVAARRPVARGFEPIPDTKRVTWRAIVTAGMPGALLIFALLFWASRRSQPAFVQAA